MKLSMSSCHGITKVLRIATVVSLLTFLFPFYVASAQPQEKPPAQKQSSTKAKAGATSPPKTGQVSAEENRKRKEWHDSMLRKPVPKKGCFHATYPSLEWQEVACVAPPPPNVRFNVGATYGDYAAVRALPLTNLISSATGSFPAVAVKTETDSLSNGADAYTLQLNTNNFFTTTAVDPVCPTASPQCKGFQQFIFENTNGNVFMEYFLSIPGATSCPSGWTSVGSSGGYLSCTIFSPAVHIGSQPASNLQSLTLTGTATAGGNDTAFVGMGSTMAAVNADSMLKLASGWVAAEFNVFGACCSSTANFNANSTITVNTTIHYGGTAAPGCAMISYTAETNNLSLVGAPVLGTQPAPAIEFTESNKPGGAPACAAAAGIGDTHLRTFSGLFYDFQAAGDFVLAEVTPGFEVQTRQVSGAPIWPNASVNKAVAARFGKARVAICLPPKGSESAERVFVDAKPTAVEDGQTLGLPEGGGITRHGNVYQMFGSDGNSVRATVNAYNGTTWMDLDVGLGLWPSAVKGLLANVNDDVNQIASRDNFVLTNPFNFDQLYHRFADSWRVGERESLLSVCNTEGPIERGIPARPFYARDLEPSVQEKALGVCQAAGVEPGALLDACTLDVAVIGQDAAAKVFVGARVPIAVGLPLVTGSSFSRLCVILFLVLLVVIAVLLWILLKRRRRPTP
ncbi:MAG: hypothetical protein EPN47_07365 [Acidobacteria bacterium]|nr:MAG: hypothetical protein EPN47_07365 [Acidobacteriota bacterium]